MKKLIFWTVIIFIFLPAATSFAETKTPAVAKEVYNDKKTNTVLAETYAQNLVEVTPHFIKNKPYLPAKKIAEILGNNYKWYAGSDMLVISSNNVFGAVLPIKNTMIVKKHNKLYDIPLRTTFEKGSLFLPYEIFSQFGCKTLKNSTQYSVYLPVWQHVYEKELDVFHDLVMPYLKKQRVLSEYSTRFNAQYLNRTANIRLASSTIDGLIIPAGKIFSFNKVVGPRTPEVGYKKAIIFFNKQKVEDYGGGICQVSSTIFNAVYKSKLQIIERKSHSLDVTYVPKGMDATVSYGYIDFVFKNNKPYPIKIDTDVRKNRLHVKLYKYE